jgi:DNA repair exonuclease SbcCD ATPase subunit
MKTKNLLCFALFITLTVLLSGCAKTDTNLESENAALKARLQKLEQQLQAANSQTASPAAQPAASSDLQSQLDDAQKKASAAADDLKALTSQVETQKEQIDQLTRELSSCQLDGKNAGKALQLYQDKTAAAIKQFQALRKTLDGQTVNADGYHQNYLATQMAVTKLTDTLPESKVRRAILGVLATFTHVNDTWETAARQMQARAQTAQAYYDEFMSVDGIGTNDYSLNMGKDRILAPVEQANAATVSMRDQQMVSSEKDIDLAIKNLQALVNGHI